MPWVFVIPVASYFRYFLNTYNLGEKHLKRNLTEVNQLNKNYYRYYEKNL